jgi:RecJ-like exonuclease
MKFFYLASEPNSEGKFEIHERDCELIPSAYDRDYLGPYNCGKEALSKALTVREASVLCEKCSSAGNVTVIGSANLVNREF